VNATMDPRNRARKPKRRQRPDPQPPRADTPAPREKFTVRLTVNIAVEAERMPNGAAMETALACAEVVAAQVLVQGTNAAARLLPGVANVRRSRARAKVAP
jgi:hypothetical protein